MDIVTDRDLEKVPMEVAISAISEFFESAKVGKVVSPPRHSVQAGDGGLTFTIGAELQSSKTIGFRVYDTYPSSSGTDTDQIVAIYSTVESQLKGLVIGSKLGAIRTAAINGYAIDLVAKEFVDTLCLIGAGYHAYYQLKAALAVRKPKRILFFNRTIGKATALCQRVSEEYNHEFECIPIENAEEGVRNADIVLCVTSSPSPVLNSSWLKKGAYISSIGPKFSVRHELPTDIGEGADLMVTDAPNQLQSYTEGYFLEDTSKIISLEDYISFNGKSGYSVFLSSGRSGTEVVVANRILEYLRTTTRLTGQV